MSAEELKEAVPRSDGRNVPSPSAGISRPVRAKARKREAHDAEVTSRALASKVTHAATFIAGHPERRLIPIRGEVPNNVR